MRFQKYPRWVDQAALAHELAGREYQVLLECPAQNFRPALYIVGDWYFFLKKERKIPLLFRAALLHVVVGPCAPLRSCAQFTYRP